ncbi:hypothetical protein ACFOS3_15945 [Paractinoplanes deccanensis]|nr:hypothetical protein [Actinoplanes deccanensis]
MGHTGADGRGGMARVQMQASRWAAAAAMMMALAGCAAPGTGRPGSTPASAVTVTVTGEMRAPSAGAVPRSAMPASAMPLPPPRRDEATCARGALPRPTVDPSASFDLNDARERARRALAQQNPPTARRGVVPEAAVPGAEACVHALRIQFSLLEAAGSERPDLGAALRSAGLTQIVVASPSFAASTGSACLYGTLTPAGPTFAIGPVTAGKPCSP